MSEPRAGDTGKSGELNNIALSLSGGGVRAVGFHLGTLEMLERLDLLKKVNILSTVSGGSMTGIGYALSQQRGHSFDRYFREFYEFLPGLNTIELLLQGLAGSDTPCASGRRDMITVMANVYDDIYFRKFFGDDGQSPRFESLLKPGAEGSHLREIIFNATEFQTGAAFRFQRSEYRCIVGNANIRLCHHHAGQIRMADIMAASSCIPAGMEPLFFPHDFHWPDDSDPCAPRPTCETVCRALQQNLHKKFHLHTDREVDYFALMDGGVYDNQGITSLLLAMNRQTTRIPAEPSDECFCGSSLYAEEHPPGPGAWAKWLAGKGYQGTEDASGELAENLHEDYDLIIISDTPVRKDSQYPKIQNRATNVRAMPGQHPHRRRKRMAGLTVGGVALAAWGLSVLLLLSAIVNAYGIVANPQWRNPRGLIINILEVLIPLLVTGALGAILLLARKHLRKFADGLYEVLPPERWGGKKPWNLVRKLRIRDLWDMVILRVGSVSALTASIFMNRIRALSYSAAYTREGVDTHIVANEIFALEPATHERRTHVMPEGMDRHAAALSDRAMSVIELAAHMPTKLWINEITEPASDDPLASSKRKVIELNRQRKSDGQPVLNDLDVLVICGQLTTCYTLMTHLWEHHRDASGTWTHPGAQRVFQAACELWNEAQGDPAMLLDTRKKSAGIEG